MWDSIKISDAGTIGEDEDYSFTITTTTGSTPPPPPPVLPTLSINNVTLLEGNNALLTVTLSAAALSDVSVQYVLTPGTATPGSDYGDTFGTLTFAAGETSKTIAVPLFTDGLAEDVETFSVDLLNPTNATIATGSGTVSIVDAAPVSLAVKDVKEDSGSSLMYYFTRAGATTSALTVNYTIGGTAVNGVDYQTIGNSITFVPGESIKTLNITPIADSTGEFDETVEIHIESGSGYSTGTNNTSTGTIINDDTLFSSSFDLLLLQDLTGSFSDDINTVQTLVPGLVAGINSLQPNTAIGVSSFLDKPIDPFGGPSPTDYVYRTDQALTTDANLIQTVYNNLVIGWGNDGPEAQLEALLQTAVRPTEIGFQTGAKHVVVLFTDADYHMAGDGAIAGITTPNNLDAVLDGTPPGTGEDYPEVAALRQLLVNANTLPIFAVTVDQVATYQNLVSQLGVGGSVVELSPDSANIINAIKQGLNNLFLINIDAPISGLVTDESGLTSSFTVKLNVQPMADVVINLQVSDVTEGSLSSNSLVFTSTNWNLAQTITVTGIDDPDGLNFQDGNQTYQIITDSIISADTNYSGINPVDITVVNQDKDSGSIDLVLNGTINNDNLVGGVGNDTLSGLEGDDVLDGASGADVLIGGTGNDTYLVDNAGDVVTETSSLLTEIDTVQSAISYSLGANLENLLLTGTAAIDGIGNELNNVLIGNDADNFLDGGIGIDSLTGGLGNDTYLVDDGGDVVTETSAIATEMDTVQSSVNYVLGANVENLILIGITDLNGTGNSLNNALTGNDGNNILDGGIGADSLTGGLGNDTYLIDNAGDLVIETSTLTTEIDTVQANFTYTLGNNVENLFLTGTAIINGTGNALDNYLTGNSAKNTLSGGVGNDTLDGGVGADSLVGGLGNDTYIVDNTGDGVTETSTLATEIDTVQSTVTYTLKTNVENLILTGTTAINGTGNTVNNVITGNSAANTLNGGTGADTLTGGLGNDIYVVDNVDVVIETSNLATEIDTVQSSVNYTLATNVEKLTLTGTAAINGIGNTLNNTLTGNTANNSLDGGNGNDNLNGGTGADTLIGGLGNDTFVVDNIGDIVTETSNLATEIDIIQSSVNYILGANVENLTLTGTTAINGTGNLLNNTITGNTGNNLLSGGAGNDILTGNAGSDILVGGLDNDTLNLGANDGVADIVRYAFGDGTDVINQFVKGIDKLAFTGISFIDVKVSGTETQLRLGNGIAGDAGFGTGTLLETIKGVTGFTSTHLGVGGTSIDATNTAQFLFT